MQRCSGDRDYGIKNDNNGDVIETDGKGGVINTAVRSDASDVSDELHIGL